MSKLNLKNNPELARQRHAEQQRAYYQRNKEYIIAMQRERRLTERLTQKILLCEPETHPLDEFWLTEEQLKQKGML